MAQALTKADKKALVTELVPLITQQMHANTASYAADSGTGFSRDMRIVERMIRVEEEIKHLRQDFTRHMDRTDKNFASLRWFGAFGVALLAVLVSIYQFLG